MDKTFDEKCLALKKKFLDMLKGKKGVMNEIIGVFILLLVVSIIAGMTFLFLSTLKDQTASRELDDFSINNETLISVDEIGESIATATEPGFGGFTIRTITNSTDGVTIHSGNYTSTSAGRITISVDGANVSLNSTFNGTNWNISYDYSSAVRSIAYGAVNDTEQAGTTIIDFLPILFLAIIFGAILTVVLRVILPFINLGQQTGF